MKEVLGSVANIETMGLVDGPGVRFIVFMQGCPLRCSYCHNPEMWPFEKNQSFTPEQLFLKLKKYIGYYKEGGVTVSGGEPLMQANFVTQFFKLCKESGIHTCLDTSGFGQDYEELLDVCDLVILDVKALEEKKYKDLTEQSIESFQRFLQTCQKKQKALWLRQVIVPGLNDTEQDVLELKKFAGTIQNVQRIELLPYHTMAEKKYKKLGIKYKLEGLCEMNKKKCKDLEKLL